MAKGVPSSAHTCVPTCVHNGVSCQRAPMPADGKVDRIVIGWIVLS
jgi:hypothetical protein